MQQITIIPSAVLNDVLERVFGSKETTFAQEALGYTRVDFEATLRHYRAALRRTLETLPDVAFKPQPPDSDGNEVWSAGQVTVHLLRAGSEVGIKDMRAFLGLPSPATAYDRAVVPEGEICTRAEALALLDAADRDLDGFFSELPDNADLSASGESRFFGPITVGGYLLAWCFHESNHGAQAAALG